MPADQQPEEAATRPVAATASAAGSFAQTTMWGRRGSQSTGRDRQPPQNGQAAQEPEKQDRTPAEQAAPATSPAETAAVDIGAELAERAGGGLVRSLDDPDAQHPPAAAVGEPAAARADGPAVSGEMFAAASEQDSAAAAARMAQSQLPEPPPMTPPAPSVGPVL
jgi:hypothetical protein